MLRAPAFATHISELLAPGCPLYRTRFCVGCSRLLGAIGGIASSLRVKPFRSKTELDVVVFETMLCFDLVMGERTGRIWGHGDSQSSSRDNYVHVLNVVGAGHPVPMDEYDGVPLSSYPEFFIA